jgi:hypothetical protein
MAVVVACGAVAMGGWFPVRAVVLAIVAVVFALLALLNR